MIETEGHKLDQSWIVFSTRHVAAYDFTERIGQYNISLGEAMPAPNEDGWPLFSKGPSHSGWGETRMVASNE